MPEPTACIPAAHLLSKTIQYFRACSLPTYPERCHNKFQLVYTYFYKHLKIITLTFSLCCETDQARAKQSRAELIGPFQARPETRCPDSDLVPAIQAAGLMTLN